MKRLMLASLACIAFSAMTANAQQPTTDSNQINNATVLRGGGGFHGGGGRGGGFHGGGRGGGWRGGGHWRGGGWVGYPYCPYYNYYYCPWY